MEYYSNEIWEKLTTPIEIDTTRHVTYQTVKDSFDHYLNSGQCVKCPLSGTIHNMPYRRSISKSMARALRALLKNDKTISPSSVGDFTKLRHWGLIHKNDNGYWNITTIGEEFARGYIPVRQHVILINNVVQGFMGEWVKIHDILAKT